MKSLKNFSDLSLTYSHFNGKGNLPHTSIKSFSGTPEEMIVLYCLYFPFGFVKKHSESKLNDLLKYDIGDKVIKLFLSYLNDNTDCYLGISFEVTNAKDFSGEYVREFLETLKEVLYEINNV